MTCCCDGYVGLHHCACPLGVLAQSMDDDPLNNAKAERWERAKRAATQRDSAVARDAIAEATDG